MKKKLSCILTVGQVGPGVALCPCLAALHRLLGEALVAGYATLVAALVDAGDGREALELHVTLAEVLGPGPELEAELGRLQAVGIHADYVRTLQVLRVDLTEKRQIALFCCFIFHFIFITVLFRF